MYIISVPNPQPDEAAKRKKTDEPTPDDPQPSTSKETEDIIQVRPEEMEGEGEGEESSPQPQPGRDDSGEPQSFIAEDNEQVQNTPHLWHHCCLVKRSKNKQVNFKSDITLSEYDKRVCLLL